MCLHNPLKYLHSTVVLLKCRYTNSKIPIPGFTFYCSSIKATYVPLRAIAEIYLHSTVVLLKAASCKCKKGLE